MEYNTISFTNIDTEEFVGRYDSEDYLILAGETRYFPSFISEHFAKHFIEKLFRRDILRKNDKAKIDEFQEQIRKEILGEEIKTKIIEEPQTTKQKVLAHEEKVKAMLSEEEKQKKAQEIEAMKIIENQ